MLQQVDAPLIIRQKVRSALEGVPVRSQLPERWVPTQGPAVTIVSDGTPANERAWTRENVRVAVYAATEPQARELATRIDAYLLDPRLVWGFSILPGPGLVTTWDSHLGGWIAAITVRAATTRKDL